MKKYIYIFCISIIFLSTYISYSKFFVKGVITKNYGNYQIFDDQNIYIIQTKNPNHRALEFDQSGHTASQQNLGYNNQENILSGGELPYPVGKNCSTINGGYFGYTGNQNDIYVPVGDINNKLTIELSGFYSKNDPNITNHINIADIYNFEAGPTLISGGVINTGLSENVSHWKWKVPRTFIIQRPNGILDEGGVDIGIYNKGIALGDLSIYINNLHIYTGNYNVINLDGGPSTSISTPDYQFNENQILPRFFTICSAK